MWAVGALSLFVMIIPTYLAVEVFGRGIYTVWTLASLYACSLGTTFMLRYKQGKWKGMKVIEELAGLSVRSKGNTVGSTGVNI
jgi:MATE family multidrug resistance protein